MKLNKIKLSLATLALMAMGTNLSALTETSSFTVTTTVVGSCNIDSSANMAFADYANGASSVDVSSTSDITVNCSNGTPYSIGLDAGNGSSSTVTTRKMGNTNGTGTDTINYSLSLDSSGNNWGNTVNTDTVDKTGNGAAQISKVYGKITAGQSPEIGSYTDTINVLVTY